MVSVRQINLKFYRPNNNFISIIKKGDIEVYVAGAPNRFVTITGDVYLDNEIAENMNGRR